MTTMNTRAAAAAASKAKGQVTVAVCEATAPAGERSLADPCRDCGHTGLAHPGEHNPVLRECVLCRLYAAARNPDDMSNLLRRPELIPPSFDPEGVEE